MPKRDSSLNEIIQLQCVKLAYCAQTGLVSEEKGSKPPNTMHVKIGMPKRDLLDQNSTCYKI